MSDQRIAFLTMEDLKDFVSYDYLVHPPLAERGWHVDEIPWNARRICWDDYAVVVIRSPWDYQQAPEEFLGVLETIEASRARLENGLRTVRWNIRKTYLRDLEQAGLRIVPTGWDHDLTADKIRRWSDTFASQGFPQPDCAQPGIAGRSGLAQLVVKPVVGANADDTYRLDVSSDSAGWEQACRTFAGRPFMVQPFVSSVLEPGEFSCFFFGWAYSHSILKTPKPEDFRVQEEHGGRIVSWSPDDELLAAARTTLEKTVQCTGELPLYARVDLVRLPGGEPALMELELIEPSLYFPFGEGSAERFAHALLRRLESG